MQGPSALLLLRGTDSVGEGDVVHPSQQRHHARRQQGARARKGARPLCRHQHAGAWALPALLSCSTFLESHCQFFLLPALRGSRCVAKIALLLLEDLLFFSQQGLMSMLYTSAERLRGMR